MKTFASILLLILSAASQPNTLLSPAAPTIASTTNASNNTTIQAQAQNQNRIAATNNSTAAVNAQNVVKIDNDFLLQLLALKYIALSMNQNNALTQLIQLHALWNANDKLRMLFAGVDVSSANIGLYYDQSTQSFALIDLSSGARTDILTLMAKLQAIASQNVNVNGNANVAVSGLIGGLPIVGPLLGGLPIVGPIVKGLGN